MLLASRSPWWPALGGLFLTGCLFPDYTFRSSNGGGGASSTTTSSTTSSTSTTSATTSSTGMMEDCFNGLDNDGNGLAGCDDPACASVTECVDAIPVGWGTYGYVLLAETDPTMPATCPSYAPTSMYSGFSGLQPGNASCSDCGCDPPTGQSCAIQQDLNAGKSGIQFAQVRDVACGANATNIQDLTVPGPTPAWDLTCVSSDTAPGGNTTCPGGACNQSVYVGLPSVVGGMCNANGGVLSKETPSWQTAVTACGGVKAAGCSGGKKCIPKPMAPFNFTACIAKGGDQSCPAPFTKKHTYYADFDDTRACSTCTCGGPIGGLCEIAINFYASPTCTGMPVATIVAGQDTCAIVNGNATVAGRSGSLASAPSGSFCSPITPTSTVLGNVTEKAATETTFCCF